jgi:2'-5' RNA ligase
MGTVRLFVGLPLPEDLAGRLVRSTADALAEVRTYPARDLHLTLCFLGDVDEDAAARLPGVLQEELRGLQAPELALDGVGGFPSLDRPRVLWAGVREVEGTEGRLDRLVERCRQAARSIGWRPRGPADHGPLTAHVTLARPRDGRAPEGFGALRPVGTWVAQDVALLESRPDRPEARYLHRATWPLVVPPGSA